MLPVWLFWRHGLPEAISKTLAVKSGKKPILSIFPILLVIVMDLQDIYLGYES